MKGQENEQKSTIKFFLDDKAFVMKKFFKTDTLSTVRHELTSKNNFDFIFIMKDGFSIDQQEENEFSLFDILDEDKIYLKSEKKILIEEKPTDKSNKNTIDYKVDTLKEKIEENDNNTISNSQFLNKPPADTPIMNNINEKKKEKDMNKLIETKKNKEEEINKMNLGKNEVKNETPNFGLTEVIKIKVFINGNYQFDYKMDKNWDLIKVRKQLNNFIKSDFLFLLPDGFIINHEEEEIFSLEGILNGDKIYINQEKLIMEMNVKNNNNMDSSLNKKKTKLRNIDNNKVEINYNQPRENNNINSSFNNKVSINNINNNNNNINNKINKIEKPDDRNAIEKSNNLQLKYLINQCIKLDNIGDLEIYLYPRLKFSYTEALNSINFMVVGQTGSGKTTLLNAFLNYLLGVKFEDNFRFKLIHEDFGVSMAESQTREVIIYNIRPLDKNIPLIRVIDTPGFGDTGGLEKDKLISEFIAEKFRTEISHINAICFVAQSTNAKLTVNQKYIFNSIMDLFSEDIKENFIAMLTFCNIIDENPVILEPLKKKGSGFDLVLPAIEKSQWYFLFDNLAIFKSKENKKLNNKIKSFYGFAMENFDEFMSKLLSLPKKTLTNTKKVLDDRKSLEAKIQILEEIVRNCLNKIDGFIQTYNIVNRYYDELKNQNFIYKVKEIKSKKVPTSEYKGTGGGYFTTCLICSHTCHLGCYIESNDRKRGCAAIDQLTGKCRVCKGKCDWNMHENRDFIWQEYEEEVTKTDEFLKQKYVQKSSEKSAKEQILEGLEQEISRQNVELMQTQEEMKNTINELKKIALNKDVFDSAEQHIDLLIENEKFERKPGWQKRVEAFNILKRQKMKLKEIYHGQHTDANKIQNFVKRFNREEIKNHSDKNCVIF